MQRSGNGVPVFHFNQDHSRHFRPLIANVIALQLLRYQCSLRATPMFMAREVRAQLRVMPMLRRGRNPCRMR
jgi:hypothetical protein